MDIHKEHCMQESLTNLDEEGPSNICYKTCKTCKKSLSTLSEYKAHIKEHKLVCTFYIYGVCILTKFLFLVRFNVKKTK